MIHESYIINHIVTNNWFLRLAYLFHHATEAKFISEEIVNLNLDFFRLVFVLIVAQNFDRTRGLARIFDLQQRFFFTFSIFVTEAENGLLFLQNYLLPSVLERDGCCSIFAALNW